MGTKGNDSFIQQPEEPTSGTLDAQTFKLECNRVQYPSRYFLWEESNWYKTYWMAYTKHYVYFKESYALL